MPIDQLPALMRKSMSAPLANNESTTTPTRISHVTNRILFALNKRARKFCTVGIGRARSTKSRTRSTGCRN